MSFGGIKITPADKWFSFFIRFRDNWTCRYCDRYCMRRKLNNTDLPMTKIECAHIFSRRHKSIRHDEGNAFSLCFHCHQQFSSDETEWKKFVLSIIGVNAYDLLIFKKNTAMPYWKKTPDALIAKFYRDKVTAIAKKEGKLWIINKAYDP